MSALLAVARLAQSLDGSRLAGSLPVPVTRLTDNVPGLRWQGGQMYKFNPPFRLKTGRGKNPFPAGKHGLQPSVPAAHGQRPYLIRPTAPTPCYEARAGAF